MKFAKLALGATAACLAASPVLAHHAGVMFDGSKEVVLEGTIKEFQWTNPHIWIQVNTTDTAGKVIEWSVEGGSPNLVGRQGWKRNSFKTGDKVTMKIHPMKDGGKGGSFMSATFADGRPGLGNRADSGSSVPTPAAAGTAR